jgi:hypothetical protein
VGGQWRIVVGKSSLAGKDFELTRRLRGQHPQRPADHLCVAAPLATLCSHAHAVQALTPTTDDGVHLRQDNDVL